MGAPSAIEMRTAIIQSLRDQGYIVRNELIHLPQNPSKADYRALNELAVKKKFEISSPGIKRYERNLIQYIANGNEVVPEIISPELVLVKPKSENELLFRYACLHWSIPVSSGYGRRLRFLVFDKSNDKLIGLFGLGDPVYAMRERDNWIEWDKDSKSDRLYHVMDAYVLGAVPPYSFLLCGKLTALLVCSNEVRDAFRNKYKGNISLIRKETRPPYLALITTTSALGRSSIYNRLRVNGHEYWTSVGYTQGSGDFHFSNGLYDKIRAYVTEHCEPTAKHASWGYGYRNKREVIKKCLQEIGLSTNLIYHGIRREIFVAQLGRTTLPFLRRESFYPRFFNWPSKDLSQLFIERWLVGRAKRMPQYQNFKREEYKFW